MIHLLNKTLKLYIVKKRLITIKVLYSKKEVIFYKHK